ncbi:MAG: hypothetical protein J6I45_09615 [Clostridia bacterium]|nr:hypothetical protein [Clostridia bacterium]
MKIHNAIIGLEEVFRDGFTIKKWKAYARAIHPELEALCLRDMEECIGSGNYTFEQNFLPILRAALEDRDGRNEIINSFEETTDHLDERLLSCFGRSVDVEVILYLGLCSGAGWVTEMEGRSVILLGTEKILELGWGGLQAMYGLIYHELGHVYQGQYGVLHRILEGRQKFLWQLFTEGIAMVFEQILVGNTQFFHQDRDGWLDWCDAHFEEIKRDFTADLNIMDVKNQRWFGDWVFYHGHADVGYYLGARFVRFICDRYAFNEILSFDILQVEAIFDEFTA